MCAGMHMCVQVCTCVCAHVSASVHGGQRHQITWSWSYRPGANSAASAELLLTPELLFTISVCGYVCIMYMCVV